MDDGFHRTREDVGRYIRDICTELKQMASDAGMPVLAYLLGMVILQADKHQRADGEG